MRNLKFIRLTELGTLSNNRKKLKLNNRSNKMKKKTNSVLGFMIVILLAVSSGLMAQTTYYVDVNVSGGSHNGSSWANAFLTIQEGVDATIAGDIVLVNDGTYNVGTTVTPGYSLNNRVCISNAITVQSLNGKAVTIIEGAEATGGGTGTGAVRGVYMSGGCTIEGFTITNGYTLETGTDYDYNGGGVWMTSNCTISYCTISSSSSYYYGGGAYLDSGGTINDCTISGNSAPGSYGGGVYLYFGGTMNVCTISGNSAETGGGISFEEGGILNDCILSDNIVTYYGGGAYLYYGGTLNDCTLNGNTADTGGGFEIQDIGSVNNCIITGNTAGYYGGGASLEGGGILNNCLLTGNTATDNHGGGATLQGGGTLNNCTLSDNTATNDYGGGAYLYYGGVLNNCIVWANTANLGGNDISMNNTDGDVLYTCASDGVVNGVDGCITDDPLFISPVSSDYHLQTLSPCIDAGNNAYVVGAYDLDGNDRIQNETVDMGAYEGGGSGISAPVNVVITFDSGSVTIVWDEVSGASSYKVFSSDDPYDNFTVDTSGNFTGTSWSAPLTVEKMFYYVTAVE